MAMGIGTHSDMVGWEGGTTTAEVCREATGSSRLPDGQGSEHSAPALAPHRNPGVWVTAD